MKKLILAIFLMFAAAAQAGTPFSALSLKRLSEDPEGATGYAGYVLGVMDALDEKVGYCIPPTALPAVIIEATRQALASIPDASLAKFSAPAVLVSLFRGAFKCTGV